MTEVVLVNNNPTVEDPADTSDDDASVKTEVRAPPQEVAPKEPKEEEKADAFLAAIMNLWAMLTGKVKEIDENAGISIKVAKFDEDHHVTEHVSEAWANALKKAGEMTESVKAKLPVWNKGEENEQEKEKEWVEVEEKTQ
ncbi:hypothetical protein ACHAXM_008600 [Skeletonema potamos]|jgi:hypothetical protein